MEHARHQHRRDFVGHLINAVVRLWNNRQPGGTVYLTNGPVTDPFAVFDDDDGRSVIENGIFKDGKYPWHLGLFPKKNEAAVVVHCHFTLAVMGLCTAFRLSQAKPATTPAGPASCLSTALLQGEGTARWRLRLKQENRDKVLVFVADTYGIFHLAVLAGMRLTVVPHHPGLLRPSCKAMILAHESYTRTPVLPWSSLHLLHRLCILSTGRWRPLTQLPTMTLVAKGGVNS